MDSPRAANFTENGVSSLLWIGTVLDSNWKISNYFSNLPWCERVGGEMSGFPWVFSIGGEDFVTMRPHIPYSLCSNILLFFLLLETVLWVSLNPLSEERVFFLYKYSIREGLHRIYDACRPQPVQCSWLRAGLTSKFNTSTIDERMSKYLGGRYWRKKTHAADAASQGRKGWRFNSFLPLVVSPIILLFKNNSFIDK